MFKRLISNFINGKKGEVNMIAIVLIMIVVIILAVIFKDSLETILKNLFARIENDINNFQ